MASTLKDLTTSIKDLFVESVIGASKPKPKAIDKKVVFNKFLLGSPKETLLVPNTIFTLYLFLIKGIALSVSITAFCSAEAVRTSGSISIFSSGIPYTFAVSIIFVAISNLFSEVAGIPSSSSVKATTKAPYFFAIGNILSILSFLPFTELIMGFPLYILAAASITS